MRPIEEFKKAIELAAREAKAWAQKHGGPPAKTPYNRVDYKRLPNPPVR